MTYKEMIVREMELISEDPLVRFIGYNTKFGHQMNGTLKGLEKSCVETPVAENLMMGIAMGLSLEGYKPIVCFERTNFLLPALDAIINHLYAMPKMSGEFNFPVILRVIIPTDKPLNPGIQHLGDYTDIIKNHTDIPVKAFRPEIYRHWLSRGTPICITEKRGDYERNYYSREF
jgi:pyruvate/2-oxoglutarate/acetoin dehydrogenase E1 component